MARRPVVRKFKPKRMEAGGGSIDLNDFAQAKKKTSTRRQSIGGKEFARLLEETRRLLDDEMCAGLTPRHFVAVYAMMHTKVYGVVPLEVRTEYKPATYAANRILKELDGDPQQMLVFLRWTWRTEKGKEQWRQENGKADDFRISWRYQFSTKMLTNYRVQLARKAKL